MLSMSTLQCLFCQHITPAQAAFCNECGQALNLRPCPQCQASNERNATTCQRCNAELSVPSGQAPGAVSSLWSRTRDGARDSPMLSEMGATTNSARRRMLLVVAALAVALLGYGASVYFYGMPAQRPTSQTQSATPDTPDTAQADPKDSADSADTPRSNSALPSTATAPQDSRRQTPELPPAAALGLSDEAAPSSSASSATSSSAPASTSSSTPSPAFAACSPAVAALGLCQPSSQPTTRQETH